MGKVERKNLATPDDVLQFDMGSSTMVIIGEQTVGRTVLEPGWRWSTHMRPHAGTEWCQSRHCGVMLSGRLGVMFEDGTEAEFGPDDVYLIPPGHDGWVIGDEPTVAIEWSGLRGWVDGLDAFSERVLATVLFTDIVDSTATAARLGDARWRELLAHYNSDVREVLARFRGREIKTTGDGFLATFDGAARAVRCAARLVAQARVRDMQIRAAVHTGEIEFVDGDARGVAVHEAARILSLAGAGDVLAGVVTRDLAAAAGFAFEDRGEHAMKGLDGPRRVFALLEAAGA